MLENSIFGTALEMADDWHSYHDDQIGMQVRAPPHKNHT
jgi:hypothetical protein